jgi:hypothetical protein
MDPQVADCKMPEKIFLTYTNATALPYQGTVLGHHIVLNYIDSNGKHHTLQGVPEHGFDHNLDKLIAFSDAELTPDDANNRDSPFGRLKALPEHIDFDTPLNQPHTLVAEGDDLSSRWALMEDFADEVNSIGYEYRPVSQNSNSFAAGALQRAGFFGPGTKFPERFDRQLVFDPVSGETRSFEVPGFEKSLANPINTETPMPFPLSAPAAQSVPPNEVRPPDRSDSFASRYGNWASSSAGIPPLFPSDRPESLDNRFGNWGSIPAGSFGDAGSPLLRALQKYKRSAAPDGPSSVAAAPSFAPNNMSEPGFGFQPLDELYAARNRAARLLGGAGRYIENNPTSSAQAASQSPPLYGSSTSDADGSPPPPPVRRLVGVRVDDPRVSAFDSGPPAAPSPSDGFLTSDRGDWFGDRFGDRISIGAGDTPQQPQDSTPSYSEMFHQYLNQLAAGQSQAPASSSNSNAPTPYQSAPPIFAPPDYSAAAGNGSIEKWIASLAGVDPDDPTQFQAPPIFSQLYRR